MAKRRIQLGPRAIGEGNPAFIIAEVGQAHDGSLGNAHAYIDAAADAGVDAVKFQTHIAAAESTLDEAFRVAFSKQDKTRYEYWQRMEFTPVQWQGLVDHARDRGVQFLSSAFSVTAVEMLAAMSMPAWKVGSGEFGSRDLMQAMLDTNRPLIVSTGMSSYREIAEIVDFVGRQNGDLALVQCTSKYPTALAEVGLNVIGEMKERFDLPCGLSDHSGKLWPSVAAIAQGADLIEVHVVFDRRMFGPDSPASLTVDEIRMLCEARDAVHEMRTNPVDKDSLAAELAQMRDLFGKSLAMVSPMPAGTVLTAGDLTTKKPGTGIPPNELETVIGRTLKQDVAADRLLNWEDLDD